jgi:hypothetical protein
VPEKQGDPQSADQPSVTGGDSSVWGGVLFERVDGVPDGVAAIAEAVRGALEAREQFGAHTGCR